MAGILPVAAAKSYLCRMLCGYSRIITPRPDCYSEGSDISLTGTLLRITWPGPPHYESVEQGDEPETYWALKSDKPVCANDAPDWGDEKLLQLTVDPAMYKTHRNLIDQHVRVSGTLLYAETGHHHTPMMIGVGTLAAEPE